MVQKGTDPGSGSATLIVMLAVQDIFEFIRKHGRNEFLVKVSFLELYNEQLFDLLSDKPRREDAIVDIREDTKESSFLMSFSETLY